jgi:hypothetical protein
MGIIKNIKKGLGYTATNKLIGKEAEYKLYEMVSNEIASGEKDIGVWTKAFSMSNGNEQMAEAKYIELMVQRYKDSIEAGQEMEEIIQKKESNYKPPEPPKETKPIKKSENDNADEYWILLFLVVIVFVIAAVAADLSQS